MSIRAAVDGSSLGNPGPGGWAWAVSPDCWAAGGWEEATNNIGELTAMLELLRATKAAGLASEQLHILADSQYAINVVSKWRHGWKQRGWTKADKKPIKNLELIQELDAEMAGRDVTFEWVKGHAGHELNEFVDDRARECAEAYRDGTTPKTGPGFGESLEVTQGVQVGIRVQEDPQDSPAPVREETLNIRDIHAQLMNAWLSGDSDTLAQLTRPNAERIWPQGHITVGFAGSSPADAQVSDVNVTQLGDGNYVVTSTLTWAGGATRDIVVYQRPTVETTTGVFGGQSYPRLQAVYMQSTVLKDAR